MMSKKAPVRMCIGCNQHKPKQDFIRVVCHKTEGISLDTTGKKPGRGAYLCKDTSCLEKAIRSKRLERTFSRAIASDVYETLMVELQS